MAWGLHVGALSLAPLSIVQAVLSGGLVFLAEVIAITSVAANLAAIIGGILVFHDPIGSGAPAIAAAS